MMSVYRGRKLKRTIAFLLSIVLYYQALDCASQAQNKVIAPQAQNKVIAPQAQNKVISSKIIYDICVVGGGPAGICTMGCVQDSDPSLKTVWVDPNFDHIGCMGRYYEYIESNTTSHDFIKAIDEVKSFNACNDVPYKQLLSMSDTSTLLLRYIVQELRIITSRLQKKTVPVQGFVRSMDLLDNNIWKISLGEKDLFAKKVVLAIGAHPKTANFLPIKTVDLMDAYKIDELASSVDKEDVVAVFGNSHSAALVIKNLLTLGVSKIINFIRSKYSITNEIFSFNAAEGVAGALDLWVKKNLIEGTPDNFIQVVNDAENRKVFGPNCTKAIYAMGFERNNLPVDQSKIRIRHDDRTGRLGNNLYGVGIAFPEGFIDAGWNYQQKVEIQHFISFLKRVMPLWLND